MTKSVLSDIETFLAHSGMAATTFGQRAVRDWRLVKRLRDGGDVTTRNADRIREFIRAESRQPPAPSGQGRAAA